MYYCISFFLLFILFFLIFFHFRKRKIIRKLCGMTAQQKSCLLNELAVPLGYAYDVCQDVFTSTTDAWQKKFGYGAVFDRFAPLFNMVIDAQPVYFDYDGKTWLIEFWKGQYGINTGCELGIYHADHIISPATRKKTIFSAVSEDEYRMMSVELFRGGRHIALMKKSHWWLTIFSPGMFSNPKDLFMKIQINFPDIEMRNAFVEGLVSAGYDIDAISLSLCHTDVSFGFACPKKRYGIVRRVFCCLVQLVNRFNCLLFRFVTRPFTCTRDRLLYLYFYLPFVFRRILRRGKACRKRH